MTLTPLTLSPCLPPELLFYVLKHQSYPTTLIICRTKADFFDGFIKDVSQPVISARTIEAVVPETEHNAEQEPAESEDQSPKTAIEKDRSPEESSMTHSLLRPTLHQVATSRHLATVFTHTISHLRAYLSVYPTSGSIAPPPAQHFDKPGTKTPLLVVYGLVALHRDTSEWSAQGLGATLAGLVEAGYRAGVRVILVEGKQPSGISRDLSVHHDDVPHERNHESELREPETDRLRTDDYDSTGWLRERLPMLSGTMKRTVLDSGDAEWSGRTVTVHTVLSRWFLPATAD